MDDALGDRMKRYELLEAGRDLIPRLPVVARLDGRCFSQFTKDMQRPFDENMSRLMRTVTKYLVQETNAVCGYTQSDEITLAWHATEMDGEIFFAGRIQKMVSVLAAMCSVKFNQSLPFFFSDGAGLQEGLLPVFDCRVWALPDRTEATNCFLWREFDATKNSISMATRHYYEHADLQGVTGSQMQELLFRKGVNWNDYPVAFKRGTYIQPRRVRRKFIDAEIAALPPKHQARFNPDLVVSRRKIVELSLPPLSQVVNRVEVIFDAADPITDTSKEANNGGDKEQSDLDCDAGGELQRSGEGIGQG